IAGTVGCGGDGDGIEGSAAAAAAPPSKCVESWNEAPESQTFGLHAYNEHNARQAEVSEVEAGRGSINIRRDEACAVIFAVPTTDEEYGDVGLAKTRFGWASMRELARSDLQRLNELQARASEQPNAVVFPDGTIGEG
ncbi:MAG: hypothetical protein ACR2K6_11250, partial [Solirubrobacterales bacterium]